MAAPEQVTSTLADTSFWEPIPVDSEETTDPIPSQVYFDLDDHSASMIKPDAEPIKTTLVVEQSEVG